MDKDQEELMLVSKRPHLMSWLTDLVSITSKDMMMLKDTATKIIALSITEQAATMWNAFLKNGNGMYLSHLLVSTLEKVATETSTSLMK